jgi:hypothetical protein
MPNIQWDKVIDSGPIVAAIIWTPKGQETQRNKGWEDAVEGRRARLDNAYYKEGYRQGLADLGGGISVDAVDAHLARGY